MMIVTTETKHPMNPTTTSRSHPLSKQDPKSSLNYQPRQIFHEPTQLYGREDEIQILQSCFCRLMEGNNENHTEKGNDKAADKINGRDRSDDNTADALDTSEASDNAPEKAPPQDKNASSKVENKDTTKDEQQGRRPNQRTITNSKTAEQKLRSSINKSSDITIKYESNFFCHAPLKRECVLLYGPEGVGKNALAQHALEKLVKEKGGWFLRGEFERDYFGGGGRSRRSNSPVEGKPQRGVRFEDEKSNDDDVMQSLTCIPLSGVIGVCREICAKVLELRHVDEPAPEAVSRRGSVRFNMSHLFEKIKDKLMQSLSLEERQMLIHSLELLELKPVLGMDDCKNSHVHITEKEVGNIVQLKKKFHYAFQKFLAVVCQFHPLVICLNDLQYADDASLDLLESVLFDRENGKLMIVGCVQCPSSEQDLSINDSVSISKRFSKKLHERIQHWQEDGGMFGLTVTDVEVNNLSIDSIKQILMDVLSINIKGDISPLAEVCYEYSHGNSYFLLRFMEILHKKKLLYTDRLSGKWSWDIDDLSSKLSSSCISDIILGESVHKLPKQAKSLLLLATCIGSTYIDEDLLFLVWSKFERKSRSSPDDQVTFRLMINESIYRKVIVKVQNPFAADHRAYHWDHESMIKAVSANVAPHAIASLRYEIGSTVDHSLGEKSDILVLARLVNSGGSSLLGSLDKKKRLKWAEKNLLAAKKAVQMSAFDSADQFAEAGIEYLPSSRRWKDHCKLMLELSSILAEVAGALGKSRVMERWCEEIVCRNELSTHDKIRAYMTLIVNMKAADVPKAVSLCLGVLRKLDCSFSRELVARDTELFEQRIAEMRVVKKEEFIAEIESLPRMDDREKIECVKLLCRLCQFYIRQSKPAFIMASTRAARWTLHYGLTAESPIMFAYLGLAYTIKEEFRVGAMNCEAALALLSRTNNQSVKVKTHFIAWYMVMPWVRHVRDSARPLLAGYNWGLQSGDVEYGMACLFGKSIIDLISGRSLQLIEQTCRASVMQMELFRVDDIALLTRMLWQTVLNLINDEIEDQTLLVGEAFNEVDFSRDPSASPLMKHYLDALKSYLYLFTGEYAKGAELALERENKFIDSVPGSALGLVDLASRGIPLVEMTRATKKRNYSKALNEVKVRSKAWSSKGVCSMIHLEYLMEAEQAALEDRLDDCCDFYKKGMTFASRSGFIQDVALINDRYASFLVSRNLNKKEAEYHRDKATSAYERWGTKQRRKFDEALPNLRSSMPPRCLKKMQPLSLLRKSV